MSDHELDAQSRADLFWNVCRSMGWHPYRPLRTAIQTRAAKVLMNMGAIDGSDVLSLARSYCKDRRVEKGHELAFFLLRQKNCGRQTAREIFAAIGAMGVDLGGQVTP